MLAAAVGYAASGILLCGDAKHGALHRETETLTIRFSTRQTAVRVLHDTGNDLTEPVSGKPVVVLERKTAECLLDTKLPFGSASAQLTALPENLAARCGLLPFHAVGTDGGLLLYFRPDSVLRADGTALDCVCGQCGLHRTGRVRGTYRGCERESKMKFLQWLKMVLRRFRAQGVHYIGGSDVLPPPLSPEEEAAAVEANSGGDVAARNCLIEHNLRLVVFLARKFESSGVGTEDLISIGTIGLIKAVSTYRSDKKRQAGDVCVAVYRERILMHLRKIAGRRSEVSIDEPLSSGLGRQRAAAE